MNIHYFICIFLYFGICNWIQMYYLVGNFVKPKRKISDLKDKNLIARIKKKTGLSVTIKIISEKKAMIGFMASNPPFRPLMIFSEKLYRSFNKDEFEWVALHESAHYFMWHMVKSALSQLWIAAFVFYLAITFELPIAISYLLFIIAAIIYIQIAKFFEYQADSFAATHMDNPRGMITGNIKMKKANRFFVGHTFVKQLFFIAVPYEKRIKMAERQYF